MEILPNVSTRRCIDQLGLLVNVSKSYQAICKSLWRIAFVFLSLGMAGYGAMGSGILDYAPNYISGSEPYRSWFTLFVVSGTYTGILIGIPFLLLAMSLSVIPRIFHWLRTH